METVGFIGLGNMGAGMAGNIQKAGYPMVVFDIREAATRSFLEGGARLASSPAEVARLSDVIFTSLPGPKEVEEVSLGAEGVLEVLLSARFDNSVIHTCLQILMVRQAT